MAENEDYDLLPHKEIVRIKKELAELKTSSEKTATKSIVNQVTNLKDSINDLLTIFKEAEETLKLEEKEPPYLKDLMHKLEVLSDQNTRIAEGIVAVADMIKEIKGKTEKTPIQRPQPRPQPFGQPTPPPGMPPQSQMPPPPRDMMPPPPDFNIPPPPRMPEEKQKKGLFGRLRK